MFARIAFALPLGAAVTACLLFVMHLMIETGHSTSDTTLARVVDFVRIERAEVVQTSEKRPDRPDPLEAAPDMPQPELAESFASSPAP